MPTPAALSRIGAPDDAFSEWLKKRGLCVHAAAADGNCMFHAISCQLRNVTHQTLREDVSRFLVCAYDEGTWLAMAHRRVPQMHTSIGALAAVDTKAEGKALAGDGSWAGETALIVRDQPRSTRSPPARGSTHPRFCTEPRLLRAY